MSSIMESLIAHTILQGSDAMFGRFLDVTAEAQQRFEKQQWAKVHHALKKRINVYDHHVELVTNQIQLMLGDQYANQLCLTAVKLTYQDLLVDYPRYDIAESFFNSVYCRIFKHRNINRDNIFVHSSQENRIPTYPTSITRHYHVQTSLSAMLERMLDDMPFTLSWQNKHRDIELLTQHLSHVLGRQFDNNVQLEQIREPFYRNKAAYLVGKLTFANGESVPLVVPVLNNGQLYLDAGICDPNDVSVIFGFARSYFMVYSPAPATLVRFLAQLLPNKNPAELYTAIGCQKHGKTEFYRQFLEHLANSTDKFIIAPGVKGMVMSVFTLPSYGFVFKIIKDKFAPQKTITQQTVKQKYQLVKEHDRVGRMADTQEYRHFSFPRNRFSDELITELLTIAPSIVTVTEEQVIIEHLYMERRMIPLNIYIENANDADLRHAVDEYGNAIKQLAAANIFPGDMLFKNFGITRHKRVVFYDYDEITYMSEMNFRKIPPPRYPEDEMAAEPWYSVSVNDVFPEEFRTFLLINPKVKCLFNELHQDLFEASYWQDLQKNINQELYPDVFPYSSSQRLQFKKPI